MNTGKKHKRILFLMITSQVLLTLFVAQWLRSQYREEREILQNRLTELYINTQDEIIDTLLFKSYVSPVLGGNSIIIKGTHGISTDPGSIDSITVATGNQQAEVARWSGTKSAITVKMRQVPDSSQKLPDTIRIRRVNDDILLRSVRMIVAHTSDTGKGKQITESFTLNPDTAVFMEHFHEQVKRSGMKFSIEWVAFSDSSGEAVHKKTMLIDPLSPFSLPGATIKSYSPYLTGLILPQILFGLLLIIITALAFTVSYRNIRSQSLLNNLRNEFVSNITHELKTPVATLSVALEALNRYNMKNEQHRTEEYLRLAGIETKRLEDLINRILDNSLLESGRQALEIKAFNINSLVAEVEDETRQRIEGKGTIEIIKNEDPLTVNGDPLFLKGVILNLVDNSIRYCDKNPEIRIISGKEGRMAYVRVIDNGPGIPEEYQKKIFEKFFRLPASDIHNVKGYGLGLSFAYQVMKLHNGSIEVKNLDPGCSFIIKLTLL